MNRRKFLKACAAAGVASAIPSMASSLFISPAFALDASRAGMTRVREARLAMGTVVTIQCAAASADQAREAMGLAFEEIDRLTALLSRFDSGSALSALNDQGRLAQAPDELLAVLRETGRVGRLSGNVFDPTVKPLADLLGQWNGSPGGLDRAEFSRALGLVDARGVRISGRKVTLDRQGMGLTLDGAAKGFIADRAGAALESAGMTDFLIDAGGDIVARGRTETGGPWTVAIQNPSLDPHAASPAVVELFDQAMATSGGYESAKGPGLAFNHILDPRTGLSPRQAASATVIAPTALEADALATAAFALGPRDGLAMFDRLPGRACLVLTPGGARRASSGWSSVG